MYYRTGRGCSKEFFNGTDARNYFAAFYSKMKTEVEQMSDAVVLSIIVDTFSQKIYKPTSIYYSTYSLR